MADLAHRQAAKRTRITEAAVEVFAERGFHSSRVSEIARRAGVADGTIYLYFKNKEDILLSIFEEKMDVLLLGLRGGLSAVESSTESIAMESAPRPIWRGSTEEILALALGACALSYEMLLFRISSLVHEPQPSTFSMVLCGFLLYWSIGAGIGSRRL